VSLGGAPGACKLGRCRVALAVPVFVWVGRPLRSQSRARSVMVWNRFVAFFLSFLFFHPLWIFSGEFSETGDWGAE
jgi:hypothetical protein